MTNQEAREHARKQVNILTRVWADNVRSRADLPNYAGVDYLLDKAISEANRACMSIQELNGYLRSYLGYWI